MNVYVYVLVREIEGGGEGGGEGRGGKEGKGGRDRGQTSSLMSTFFEGRDIH